jgi:hypothetical protein
MIQNLLKTIGPKFARRVYSSASRAVVTPEITPYPDTRITTLPSAFRVVSESTYLPTATVNSSISNIYVQLQLENIQRLDWSLD